MAKEFAIKFYRSKAWQVCRQLYIKSVHGLCERCLQKEIYEVGNIVHHKVYLNKYNVNDPTITLNPELLEYLCTECHNKEHMRVDKDSINNNLVFNEFGEIEEKKNVFIVWGSPASGKTTWVKANMGKYDVIVDLDKIIQALCLTNVKVVNRYALEISLDLIERLYQIIENHLINFEKVYVIAMLPNKNKREALRRRLKAELIHIDTDRDTCLERAMSDTERVDKYLHKMIINKYFDELEGI